MHKFIIIKFINYKTIIFIYFECLDYGIMIHQDCRGRHNVEIEEDYLDKWMNKYYEVQNNI